MIEYLIRFEIYPFFLNLSFSWYIGGGAALIIYIIGVMIEATSRTAHNFKFYGEGFWDSYTTNDNREMTPKDVWIAMCWPVFGILYLIKGLLGLLNDFMAGFFLIFGFKYKRTKTFKWINKKLWGI